MTRLAALPVLALPVLALLLTLTACSGDDAATAEDPTPTDAPASSPASSDDATVPPAPVPAGEVSAVRLGTVLDDGTGPQLCLGVLLDSYPPQCGGLVLAGWDWAEQQGFEEQPMDGKTLVRWGEFAVSGHWDGSVLTVTGAIPAALYDAIATDPPTYPEPATPLSRREERRVLKETLALPGVVDGSTTGEGQVRVAVAFDDGSLQAWVDRTYGENAVVVTGVLVERTP